MKRTLSLLLCLLLLVGFVPLREANAAITHTVTFETNGGSLVASIEVEYGRFLLKPTDPTRAGWTFDA